eukprot:gene29342-biopygen7694
MEELGSRGLGLLLLFVNCYEDGQAAWESAAGLVWCWLGSGQDVVADLVLRALRLEAPICDISAVCRLWHSIVVRNIAEVLVLRENGDMFIVLRRALKHHKLDVAMDLVSRPRSSDESEDALVLVAKNGHTDLTRCLMQAPQHVARADCHDGEALVEAAAGGHIEVVRMLLDAPQHAAHADCQGGLALSQAAHGGHIEVVRMLLYAPQHAARADCLEGDALVTMAQH